LRARLDRLVVTHNGGRRQSRGLTLAKLLGNDLLGWEEQRVKSGGGKYCL
jgi:hypothetical protein